MKWIVVWIALSWFSVPCDTGPTSYVDEYGRESMTTTVTLMNCIDHKQREMERYFDTLEEAQAFVKELERADAETWTDDFKDIKIYLTDRTEIP